MNKKRIKSLAYMAGKLLGILGLAYILYKLSQEYSFEKFSNQFHTVSYLIPILLLMNITSSLIGNIVWYKLLGYYAKKPVPLIPALFYFSRTEVAKYLPGNVFHFVGRQVFASKLGLSQSQMARTSLFFTLSLLIGSTFTAAIFGILGNTLPAPFLTLMALTGLGALAIGLKLFPTLSYRQKLLLYFMHMPSLIIQGIMLALVIWALTQHHDPSYFFNTAAIFIVSWLIGFVTPGASGGLGVRESAFLAISEFIHLDISTDVVLFAILFIRFINILTDIVLYLSTYLMKPFLNDYA